MNCLSWTHPPPFSGFSWYAMKNCMQMSLMKTQSTMRFTHESGSVTMSSSGVGSITQTSKGVTLAVKSMASVVTLSHRCMNGDVGSSVLRRLWLSCWRTFSTCKRAACWRASFASLLM